MSLSEFKQQVFFQQSQNDPCHGTSLTINMQAGRPVPQLMEERI